MFWQTSLFSLDLDVPVINFLVVSFLLYLPNSDRFQQVEEMINGNSTNYRYELEKKHNSIL